MRVAIREIEKLFGEIEQAHGIKKGILSEIYKAEARVVFLGRRRNILPDIRKIVQEALQEDDRAED
jgi:hypothetical protein